jgi:hypothetical protein
MKKLFLSLAIAVALLPALSSKADAAYISESDKTISIQTGLNLNIPLNIGESTFELQEGLQNVLTETTGVEVDHYYLWLELDGQKIVGIDPAKAMY